MHYFYYDAQRECGDFFCCLRCLRIHAKLGVFFFKFYETCKCIKTVGFQQGYVKNVYWPSVVIRGKIGFKWKMHVKMEYPVATHR